MKLFHILSLTFLISAITANNVQAGGSFPPPPKPGDPGCVEMVTAACTSIGLSPEFCRDAAEFLCDIAAACKQALSSTCV